MKRILLLLLPLAIACSRQPVEQFLNEEELINKFSGYWRVYNVESGEYESNYWVIDTSGLCYLACDEGFEGKPISDYYSLISEYYSPISNSEDYQIGNYYCSGCNDDSNYYNAYPAGFSVVDYINARFLMWDEQCTGNCKFKYSISLTPKVRGELLSDLGYNGDYIDSLDIWTNKYWTINGENVYRNGTYELHRMKR